MTPEEAAELAKYQERARYWQAEFEKLRNDLPYEYHMGDHTTLLKQLAEKDTGIDDLSRWLVAKKEEIEKQNGIIEGLQAKCQDQARQIKKLQDTRDGWIKLFSEQTFEIAEQAAHIAKLEAAYLEAEHARIHYGCKYYKTKLAPGEAHQKAREALAKLKQS